MDHFSIDGVDHFWTDVDTAQTVTEEVGSKLLELIVQEPKEYNYARTRWTSEMLAEPHFPHQIS